LTLEDIAAVFAIAVTLSVAFDYLIIKPLQKAIDMNSSVLEELKRELERSAMDRRDLDGRVRALETAHEMNSKRIEQRATGVCQIGS
jgi:hypothetical protein